jgi:outer membrane immunogenic protein
MPAAGGDSWPTVIPSIVGGGLITIDEGKHGLAGALIGGQLGGNLHVDGFLFGIEASLSYSPLGPRSATADISWLSTVTGRLGFASERWLLYGKGGWAGARAEVSTTVAVGSPPKESGSGWTVGGGLEFKFSPELSLGVEYAYMDFGTKGNSSTPVPSAGVDMQFHAVTARLNYRFGG